MSRNIIVVDEDDSIFNKFAGGLQACNISGAPVVSESGQFLGVISGSRLSNKKVLKYLRNGGTLGELKVKRLIVPGPLSRCQQER